MPIIENIKAGMEYKYQICYTKRTFDMASVLLIVMFYCLQGGRPTGSVKPCEVSEDGTGPHNSVVFSLKNQVGGLARALQVFQVMFRCFFANLRTFISLLTCLFLQVRLLNYSTYLNQSLYSIYVLKLLRLYCHSPIGPI
jgi:hypothetical protein